MSAIPLAIGAALRGSARRTRVIAGMLMLAAGGLVLAFMFASANPHTRTIVPLPRRAQTVLVLDLSGSISWDKYLRIGEVLGSLAHSHRRFGLVLFSDQAYEALPPGTPAADLVPLTRYFTLTQGKRPTFPANPWLASFSGGTRISAGLALAERIARAQRPLPTVMLVSDLDDDPHDIRALTNVLPAFPRDGIRVRLVGLDATPENVTLFRSLLRPTPPVSAAPTPDEASPRQATVFPWALVGLTLAASSLLGLRGLWAPRLDWERR